MLTFLGIKVSYETLAFLALFVASEVVGLSKYRSNSVVQVFLKVVDLMRPMRQEDDKIKRIKDSFKG